MELKQLEAFVAVVDYNSFSEAARHLFLTQPTVSAHVASLEKDWIPSSFLAPQRNCTSPLRDIISMILQSPC